MKKSLISVCLLLALAACQGDELKSKAPAVMSPPAPVTTPIKAAPEEMAAELKASVTELAEKTETAMKDATMQIKQGAANASVQAEATVEQLKPAVEPAIKVAKEAVQKVVKQATLTMTTGDIEKGKALARKCAACHSFESKNKMGPGLAGVLGREAGSVSGFKYQFTDFIKPGKAWHWDEAHLAAWVCDSKNAVKDFTGDAAAKTKMGAQRICDTSKQADIIAYLKTL